MQALESNAVAVVDHAGLGRCEMYLLPSANINAITVTLLSIDILVLLFH